MMQAGAEVGIAWEVGSAIMGRGTHCAFVSVGAGGGGGGGDCVDGGEGEGCKWLTVVM